MLTSPALLTSAQANGQTQNNSLSQLGEDYESFLTLLTAQLTNQDPLSPVDSTDFVAQLAQLSQVEQAVQTNDQMATLTDQMRGLINISGLDLIGREVKALTSITHLANGEVTSSYTVAEGAISAEATIRDPLGRVVRTLRNLDVRAGIEHPLPWDGLDDNGVPQLEGYYSVELTAVGPNDEAVDVDVYRFDEVAEVIFERGELLFTLAGGEAVSSVTVVSTR